MSVPTEELETAIEIDNSGERDPLGLVRIDDPEEPVGLERDGPGGPIGREREERGGPPLDLVGGEDSGGTDPLGGVPPGLVETKAPEEGEDWPWFEAPGVLNLVGISSTPVSDVIEIP